MRTIVVNLPVRKLEASEALFSEFGFTFNPEFSDDKTACMVVADNAFIMLVEQGRFRDFIVGEISDATTTEVVTSLSAESREQVDALVAKAIAAGGSTYDKPEDLGFMYSHSFVDPDGHGWGLFHISDMSAQK